MRPISEFDRNCPHGHLQVNGRPARIIGEINNAFYPLAVVHTLENGRETVTEYTVDGRFVIEQDDKLGRDLINAPAPKKRVQGWVNVYRSVSGYDRTYTGAMYPTKEKAEEYRGECIGDRVACIYIDVEEGEGLS